MRDDERKYADDTRARDEENDEVSNWCWEASLEWSLEEYADVWRELANG